MVCHGFASPQGESKDLLDSSLREAMTTTGRGTPLPVFRSAEQCSAARKKASLPQKEDSPGGGNVRKADKRGEEGAPVRTLGRRVSPLH